MDKFETKMQVTKPLLPPIEEFVDKIKGIWERDWLTNNGPLYKELEDDLKKYLKVNNATLFTNGHLALDIAIKALGLTGEVITTPFTFASTTHAIVMNNLKPVFCDINLKDLTIDVDKIEDLITDKTSAIIPVHVFGYPCNVTKIEEIAKKHNLKVIYDAAHVFGVEVNGKGIGSFGDISMFSLHATKVYNSIEGGVLTYNNEDYKKKLGMFKNFGINGKESVEVVGLNAKMNEFQAAMGLCNLKYIDDQIKKRQIIVNRYRELLSEIDGISYLEDMEGVRHNYSYFPIIINETIARINRDELCEKMQEYNIFTRKYFYPLITDFDCYKGKYNDSNISNAKYVSENILTLPIYGELKIEDVDNIVEVIRKIVNNRAYSKNKDIIIDEFSAASMSRR